MDKKYELSDLSITVNGTVLYRVKALKDFGRIESGELGGFIESEDNLSHEGNCWVCEEAEVSGNARVTEDAWVCGGAQVYGNAQVCGNADINEEAQVYGNAKVSGFRVGGKAQVCGNATIAGKVCVYGTACVCGDAHISKYDITSDVPYYIHIRKNVKIDHGVWSTQMYVGDDLYLLSTTLDKILIT